MSEPIRWIIPAVLLVSVAGIPVALWWERRHPTSYPKSRAHRRVLRSVATVNWRDDLAAWRAMSSEAQAAYDAWAIGQGAAEHGAEEAARLAVERAAHTNSLFRP